jgi:HK97 gp10 family phage protein
MPRTFRLDRMEVPELEEMTPKIRRRVMRPAARVVALKVRAIAPDSGRRHKSKLNKTIRYQVRRGGLEGVVAAKAPHAHLVHNGTRPHDIPIPRENPHTIAHHPGARAQPFLLDAARQTRGEVEQVLRDGARAAMEEIANGI